MRNRAAVYMGLLYLLRERLQLVRSGRLSMYIVGAHN